MNDKMLLYVILGVAAVSLYISYRTASGLQSATTGAQAVNDFISPFLTKIGVMKK